MLFDYEEPYDLVLLMNYYTQKGADSDNWKKVLKYGDRIDQMLSYINANYKKEQLECWALTFYDDFTEALFERIGDINEKPQKTDDQIAD